MVCTTSPLHRLLRIAPGHAPHVLCCTRECSGFDLIRALEFALIAVALFLYQWHSTVAAIAATLTFVIIATLHEQFCSKERLARSRIRRGECVACGNKPGAGDAACSNCGQTLSQQAN